MTVEGWFYAKDTRAFGLIGVVAFNWYNPNWFGFWIVPNDY